MDYALELKGVMKKFPESDFALRNVSFSLPSGTIMGLVGENGAGKTTTIGCILNCLFRDAGSIQIFGKAMHDEDPEMRNDIGVVFDGGNFPGYLTAENIAAIMRRVFTNWMILCLRIFLNRFV